MAAVEITLLVCGIICIVVSFIFEFGSKTDEGGYIAADLTAEQKEKVKKQIAQLLDEELENLNERTEASLDKISNTKILELNEYAENILEQINRNHNEAVFLYDMLNEKAKEVKNTVKDVNTAKRQVELMYQPEQSKSNQTDNEKSQNDLSDAAKAARERLVQLDSKSTEKLNSAMTGKGNQAVELDKIVSGAEEKTPAAKKDVSKRKNTKTVSKEAANMNIQFEKGANNNDNILELYKRGVSNKDIAKQLNLGVGEVKLVIDLYNGGK